MRKLRTYFITGLLVITPIILTIFSIKWLFNLIDGILGGFVSIILVKVFGFEEFTEPIVGLGFIAILFLILFTGMLARNYFGGKLIKLGEWIVKSIPLVNKVYNAFKQISGVFISEKRDVFTKAVLIEYPRKGLYSIVFMTRDAGGEIKDKLENEMISVFLPSTPNPTTGFLLFVPKDEIIELDMTIEDSMKLIISGGAVLPENTDNNKNQPNNKLLQK